MSSGSAHNSMDNYSDSEDMTKLLTNLDIVSIDRLELLKRSFHDCLNNTKNTECLKALVTYYLKFNSQRALDILVGVREPHDRNLFDILVEYMKQSTHRQQSLILISHIVHKSPAWLPKIINNSKVLQSFFTILKTDQEVVPLVTSLLILVELISTLPSIMAPCLSDIFECFSRLCYSLAKQSTQNTTTQDFNTLHLHACVYRLFHRLYAMYPCNFLAYLRSTYGSTRDPNKENLTVFNEILKPMLQRVRLHPLLVTAAKETEFSNTRWVNMEPHDIVAECAKLALDPIEGVQEECDFCSDIQLFCSASLSSFGSHGKSKTPVNEESITPLSFAKANSNSIIGQVNHELTNGKDIVSISSMIKDMANNPRELENDSLSEQPIASNDAKKGPSLHVKIKSEPSFDVAQEAIPVLEKQTRDTSDRNSANSTPEVLNQRSVVANESQQKIVLLPNDQTECLNQTVADEEEEDNEVSEINANASHLTASASYESSRIEGPMTPFISTTCYLTDDKHEYVCTGNELRTEETNDLVGNIKSSFRHANSRLRYQSHCMPSSDLMADSFSKCLTLKKCKSCPILYFSCHCEEQNKVKVSKTTPKVIQNSNSNLIDNKSKGHDLFKYDNTIVDKSDFSRISSMTSSMNCNCNCLGYVNSDGTAIQKVCNCTCTGNVSLCQYLYQYYNNQSRSNIHRSISKNSSATDRQQNSLSPLEILNRHLTLGSDICLREMNNPLTSKKDTDWNHFGGQPPNDEMIVLKNQIALMHSQLLFERQQRENHAIRNRRLLKKAKECIALQEKFRAQRDQLLSQEKEIEILKKEISNCRENLQRVETETSAERKRFKEEILSYAKRCNDLEENKKELTENIALYKDQTKVLHISYQKLEAKNLELEEDLKRFDKQNGIIENIKKDNRNLKTQVLMLSELYQGLKDRYSMINKNASSDEIFNIENEALHKELKELKAKLEATTVQMEAFKGKSNEIEALLIKKDHIISDQKQTIESNKASHKLQLQIEKQRVQALRKVIQQLEQHILSLYGQLGMREHEQRLRRLNISDEQSSSQTLEGSSVANNSNSAEEPNDVNSHATYNYSNGNHSGN